MTRLYTYLWLLGPQSNRTPIYKAELFFRCLDFRVQSGAATPDDLAYLRARGPIVAGESQDGKGDNGTGDAAAAGKRVGTSTLSRMVEWLEQLRIASSSEDGWAYAGDSDGGNHAPGAADGDDGLFAPAFVKFPVPSSDSTFGGGSTLGSPGATAKPSTAPATESTFYRPIRPRVPPLQSTLCSRLQNQGPSAAALDPSSDAFGAPIALNTTGSTGTAGFDPSSTVVLTIAGGTGARNDPGRATALEGGRARVISGAAAGGAMSTLDGVSVLTDDAIAGGTVVGMSSVVSFDSRVGGATVGPVGLGQLVPPALAADAASALQLGGTTPSAAADSAVTKPGLKPLKLTPVVKQQHASVTTTKPVRLGGSKGTLSASAPLLLSSGPGSPTRPATSGTARSAALAC